MDRDGQLHPEVQYVYSNAGVSAYFTNKSVVLNLKEYDKIDPSGLLQSEIDSAYTNQKMKMHRIDMMFPGSNPDLKISAKNRNRSYVNYFLNKRDMLTSVNHYQKLIYENLYDHIDLIFYVSDDGLKYDFVLHPGADITDIKLRYRGAESVKLKNNRLVVETKLFPLIEEIPMAWANDDMQDQRQVNYTLEGDLIGFETDSAFNTLCIDPTVNWATFFETNTMDGSISYDHNVADDAGNLFISGYCNNDANDYPTIDPGGSAYVQAYASNDLYIAKFDSNRSLVWSTYFGGSNSGMDWGLGTEVMATHGNVLHIVGDALSSDATFLNGGGFFYNAGSTAPYYLRFNKNTGELLHSTNIPGHSSSHPSIAINSTGEVAIILDAYDWGVEPAHIVTRPGAYNQGTNGGFTDLFLMLLDNSYDQIWGTFLGGPGTQEDPHVCFDGNNNIFFVGEVDWNSSSTAANEHLVDPGGGAYYQTTDNTEDVMIGKFNNSGALVWNTLYGGNGYDGIDSRMGNGSKVIVDPDTDELLVIGGTNSTNLPLQVLAGAYNITVPSNVNTSGGSYNDFGSFILKFSNSGVMNWATYWGGDTGGDLLYDGIFTDCDQLFLAARASYTPMPVTGYYNNASGGQSFLMEMDGNFSAVWSSYIGDNTGVPQIAYTPFENRLYLTTTTNTGAEATLDPGGGAYYDGSFTGPHYASYFIWDFDVVPPPVADDDTICSGQSAILTASGGVGPIYNWYDAASGGTLLHTGASFTTPALTADATYYVSASGGVCESVRVPVNVIVTAGPTVTASASPSTICNGQSSLISASGADTYTWDQSLGAGNSHTVSPSADITYTVTGTDVNGCEGTATVSITVDPGSVAPTGADATPSDICSGSSSTLSVIGGSLEPGATWEWYTGSCGGTSAGSGSSISVSPSSTTTYYVRAEGSCNTTACASVTVTIKTNSTAPSSASASPDPVCLGDPVVLSFTGGTSGTGAIAQWYESSCGGTAVGSGNSLSVTPSGTTTYYVRYEGDCNTTSCVSVSVTTDAGGNPDISPAGPFCTTGSAVTLSAADAGGTWSGTGITDVSTGEFDPSVAGSGDHVITYTLPGPCADSDTETIHVDDALDATISPQSDMCASDAIIFLSAADAGGTWSGPGIVDASTGEFDPAAAGSGDITISYVIGSGACLDSDTETFHVYADVDATINAAGPFCTSDSPVLLTAASAGGTWSGTGITDPATGEFDPGSVTPGNYVITYDIVNGECSDSDTESISVQDAPDPTITSATDFCVNGTSVLLSAASSGGTWSGTGITDPATGAFDPSTAGVGTHTITYENTAGSCVATDQVDIEVHAEPDIITDNTVEPLCYGQANGSIQISSSADSPVFTWPDMSTGDTYSNASAGSYTVSVQDAYGCTSSQSIVLGQPAQLTASFSDVQQPSCNGDNDGSLTATATGGTVSGDYSWTWSTGDNVQSVTNLPPGTYSLTVSDDNGCQIVISETLSEPDEIMINASSTDVQCSSAQTGACSVSVSGGSGSYTYAWEGLPDTAPTVSDLSAGTYTVSVEDMNGCSGETDITVGTIGNLNLNIDVVSEIACAGDANGELTVQHNGQAPFSYLWTPGSYATQTINALPAGNYQVVVNDDLGCTGSASAELNSPTAIAVNPAVDSITCYGSNDGAVSLNISGGSLPYVINWSNGSAGPDISNLNGGWYSFTITDSNGCQMQDSVFVYEPVSGIYPSVLTTNISCYGIEDGVAHASVSGGTPPYFYQWYHEGNEISTDSVADNLGEGFYQLQVNDSQGCAADTSVTITQPAELQVTYVTGDPSCIGNSDGYIHLQVSGGTAPYRVIIEGVPMPFLEIDGLQQGNYNLVVQDANECRYELNTISLVDNPVDCIRIPNAFTPNGDDSNDTWIIENLDLFDNYIVSVFNRWGQKLYEGHPGNEPWDGTTTTGKLVPTGSYVYVVNLNNGMDPYSGVVTVVY